MKKHSFWKGILALATTAALVFTAVLPVKASDRFKDITGHWAAPVITSWTDKGRAAGYPDGSFRPDNPVTRAEFMTMANKAFEFKTEKPAQFTDVPETAWYAAEVRKALAAGYITGYPDNTARPGQPVSRQEAAVIIAKIMRLSAMPGDAETFTDSIPEWSRGQVGAVAKAGHMTGYPDGSFKPFDSITRAEALAALDRAYQVWCKR